MRTVRCACTEPAGRNNLIATHTPARLPGSTPPDGPPPALPTAREQTEASGSAVPASLGMTDRER